MAEDWSAFQVITPQTKAPISSGGGGEWDSFQPVEMKTIGPGADTSGTESPKSTKAAPDEAVARTLPSIPGAELGKSALYGALGPVTEKGVPKLLAKAGQLLGEGVGATPGERYHSLEEYHKASAERFRSEHPYQAFGGRTAGMLATAATPVGEAALGLRAGSIPAMIGRGAASGAALGAGGAVIGGEDPSEAAKEGAALGAAGGLAGGVLGRAIGGAGTVGKGLAAGSPEEVRTAAAEAMARRLDPAGRILAGSPEEAAQRVAGEVQTGFARETAATQGIYGALSKTRAHFSPKIAGSMASDIEADLMSPGAMNAGRYLNVHRDITPGAMPVWNAIQDAEPFMRSMATQVKMGAVAQPRADFKAIVAQDQRIGSLVNRVFSSPSSSAQDRYVAQTLKQSWRDWIDQTVNRKGVLQGPDKDQAVQMWRDAMAQHAKTQATYRPRGDAASTMQTILGQPNRGVAAGTPADVARSLFNNLDRSETQVALNHVRSVLGSSSSGNDAWNALRQGMVQHLMTGEPQQVARNLERFLGPGSTLATQLFPDAAHRQGLQLLLQGSRQMAEKPGAARQVMSMGFRLLAPILGFAHHGPFGAMAGFMAHHGIDAFREAGQTGRVARAFAGQAIRPGGRAARVGAAGAREAKRQ